MQDWGNRSTHVGLVVTMLAKVWIPSLGEHNVDSLIEGIECG